MDIGRLRDRARRLALRIGRQPSGPAPGFHRSSARGPGLSFAGHREYQYGDDIRMVDWKAAARLGRPFIKLFEQERGTGIVLVLDGSASMRSPDAGKWRAAREAAALLALIAAGQGDAVGAVLVTSHVEAVRPPRRGSTHADALVRWLGTLEARGDSTAIAAGIAEAARRLPHGGVIAVLSDFFASHWDAAVRRASTRHTVVGIRVVSPGERSLPPAGLVLLRDVETGGQRWIDTESATVRGVFADRTAALSRTIRLRLAGAGAIPVELDAADTMLRGLQALCRPAGR
jgi:uncharacterized protein (DUF58 family)